MSPLYILTVSLFLIPLCGPIIIEPIIAIRDLWTTKEFLVLMAILGMTLFSHREHQSRRNPFLTALLLFLPISIFAAPPLQLIYGHENLAGLWMWRGLAWCFVYYILYVAVCNNPPVRERQKTAIIRAIGLAAIISAGYAYIQALGFDQWQIARPYSEIGTPAATNITAVIGNPTYLSVWLVMCLPFIVLFFRWYWVIFVLGAVLLCKSDIGIAGAVITLVFMACMRARSTIWLKAMIGTSIAVCLILWASWAEIRPKIHDNGRFAVWAQTFEDWRSPCIKIDVTGDMSMAQKQEVEKLNKRTYSLTGRGLGSFPFIFGTRYTTNYESAHNEYLEGLYSIGLIGMGIFLAVLGFVFYHVFQIARVDTFCMALYASLFFCYLAAAGLPTVHVEPLRFYSAVMFCLLSSLIQIKIIRINP